MMVLMKYLGFVFVAAVSLGGIYALLTAINLDGSHFKSGACIQMHEREPWDKREIWKVEMVGKHHYLVRRIPESIYATSAGIEISFLTAQDYHEVPCPK